MTKNQGNIIIVLLILVIIGLAAVSYHLWSFRNDIENYEANLKAYLQAV